MIPEAVVERAMKVQEVTVHCPIPSRVLQLLQSNRLDSKPHQCDSEQWIQRPIRLFLHHTGYWQPKP